MVTDNTVHILLVFLGDLADAIRSHTNITFGLYHSLYEWFNPLYLKDSANKFSTQYYVKVNVVFTAVLHNHVIRMSIKHCVNLQ